MNRARLLSLVRGSRFEGHLYERADGTPVAATTGHWLVVLAPLDRAEAAMTEAVATGNLPPTLSVAKIVKKARLAEKGFSVGIHPGLEPDPDLFAIGKGRLEQALAQAQGRVALAQQALDARLEARSAAKLPTRGSQYGITELREKLSEAKADLREIKPGCYLTAVRCGDAYFDLRIVRAALTAMGATRGTLVGTGSELDMAVVHTPDGKSVGFVMPFRK